MRRLPRRYALLLILVVLDVGLLAAAWRLPTTRLVFQITLLLPEVFVDLPIPADLIGEEIVKNRVAVPYGDAIAYADLYRPEDTDRHAAMLIVPGAAPQGLDDPRVIRLAEFAARLGFVVIIPELPDLMEGVVHPGEVEGVVAAFRFLQQHPSVDGDRIGVLGFSVGGGLALLAAADPRMREAVGLVGSFGGYYDLEDVIVAAMSRSIPEDGKSERWQPSKHTLRVIRRSLLHAVDGQPVAAALEGETDPGTLSPDARLVYDLLAGARPAADLLRSSPPHLAAVLDELSPASRVDDIRADVFLMHSRDDPLIPHVESRKLRDALASQGIRVRYRELSAFRHLNPVTADPASIFADAYSLLFISYALMLELQ